MTHNKKGTNNVKNSSNECENLIIKVANSKFPNCKETNKNNIHEIGTVYILCKEDVIYKLRNNH